MVSRDKLVHSFIWHFNIIANYHCAYQQHANSALKNVANGCIFYCRQPSFLTSIYPTCTLHIPQLIFSQLFLFGKRSEALVQVNGFCLQPSASLHTLVFTEDFLLRGLVSEMQGGGVPLDSYVRTTATKLLITAFYHTAMAEPKQQIMSVSRRTCGDLW